MLKFIDETLALVVQEQTTDTTKGLSSQELDLSLGLIGVDQTSWVDLNFLKINCVRANSESDLVSITGTVISVSGREVVIFRAVLLKKRILGEVSGIATSSKNNGTVSSLALAGVGVVDTNDGTVLILDEVGNTSLLLDDDTLGVAYSKILETFHLSVGDDHTGELGIPSVSTGM